MGMPSLFLAVHVGTVVFETVIATTGSGIVASSAGVITAVSVLMVFLGPFAAAEM